MLVTTPKAPTATTRVSTPSLSVGALHHPDRQLAVQGQDWVPLFGKQPSGSKYPIFEAFDSKKHVSHGFGDQGLLIFGYEPLQGT